QPCSTMSSQHVVGVDKRYSQPRPVLHRLADSVEEGLIGEAGQADLQEGPLPGPGLSAQLFREGAGLTSLPGGNAALAARGRLVSSGLVHDRVLPGLHRSPSNASSSRSPALRSYSGFQPVARISLPGSAMRWPSPGRLRPGSSRTASGSPRRLSMVARTSPMVVPVPVPTLNTSKPCPEAVATIAFAVSVTKIRSRWGQRLPSSIGWPARMAATIAGSTWGFVSRGP